MAALTQAEFRARVAKHLRLYQADVIELSAETAADLDESIADASEELRERGLCWWDDDAVPQAVVFALVLIVCAQACTKVGKAGQGYESGDGDGRVRLTQLKQSAVVTTVEAEYF